jgi:hypothetical protein
VDPCMGEENEEGYGLLYRGSPLISFHAKQVILGSNLQVLPCSLHRLFVQCNIKKNTPLFVKRIETFVKCAISISHCYILYYVKIYLDIS